MHGWFYSVFFLHKQIFTLKFSAQRSLYELGFLSFRKTTLFEILDVLEATHTSYIIYILFTNSIMFNAHLLLLTNVPNKWVVTCRLKFSLFTYVLDMWKVDSWVCVVASRDGSSVEMVLFRDVDRDFVGKSANCSDCRGLHTTLRCACRNIRSNRQNLRCWCCCVSVFLPELRTLTSRFWNSILKWVVYLLALKWHCWLRASQMDHWLIQLVPLSRRGGSGDTSLMCPEFLFIYSCYAFWCKPCVHCLLLMSWYVWKIMFGLSV
jgi:hypothetical protein